MTLAHAWVQLAKACVERSTTDGGATLSGCRIFTIRRTKPPYSAHHDNASEKFPARKHFFYSGLAVAYAVIVFLKIFTNLLLGRLFGLLAVGAISSSA